MHKAEVGDLSRGGPVCRFFGDQSANSKAVKSRGLESFINAVLIHDGSVTPDALCVIKK